MIDGIYGRTNMIIEKAMQLRMMRQNLLASNIANAETPTYRAVDIDFKATMEELLQDMDVREARKAGNVPVPVDVQTAHGRHLTLEGFLNRPESPREPQIVFAAGDSRSMGNDSNSVDLEEQTARMQTNSTLYQVLAQLMARRLQGVKQVIASSNG